MNLRSASSIAVCLRVCDAPPNAPRCIQRPFFVQSHDSTDRQHPSTVKTCSPARSDRQRSSGNPNLPPIPRQFPTSSPPATIFIGHSAHHSTIRPPNDTPRRPKRAPRRRTANRGRHNTPRASPPPSPSAILRTTAQSDHRTTPLNGQNAPHGTEWPPNRTPQWPKYAIRHKEAEEQHAKPPASAETRLPEDEICTYNR